MPLHVNDRYGSSHHEILAEYCLALGFSLRLTREHTQHVTGIGQNHDWSDPTTFPPNFPRDLAWEVLRRQVILFVAAYNPEHKTKLIHSPSLDVGLRIELADALDRAEPDVPPAPGPSGLQGAERQRQTILSKLSKGNVRELVEYMWDKDQATYEKLEGPVFDGPVLPQTVRALTSEASKQLKKAGVGWRLKACSRSGLVTKEFGPSA
jgi:hypothetical protein